jgi:NAD dependent epimerase/dehydratase family enzyme
MLNRSVKLNLPQRILIAIYGKERSKLILKGRQVIPMRTLQYGFKYEYREIIKALENILRN